MPTERRRATRLRRIRLLHADLQHEGQRIRQGMGRTLNLTRHGLLLEAHFALEPGQVVSLALGIGEDVLEITGRVIHTQAPEGSGPWQAGIEFQKISDADGLRLQDFLAKSPAADYLSSQPHTSAPMGQSKKISTIKGAIDHVMNQAVYETHMPELTLLKKGKVRDIYDLGDALLMVATDRMSAFDVILPDPIPDKGKILTQISLFWFEVLRPLVKNHVISGDVADFPSVCAPYADVLRGRSMLVKKADPLPIECVVRGYITGSGWQSYLDSREVCGISLPDGLSESDRLAHPLFTPSTKEDVGAHDINIDFQETVRRIGGPLAEKIRDLSLAIYQKGVQLADEKGIIIADTKFEFGMLGDSIVLIDEVLTPDSSRFWPKADYRPGGSQKSFDKQYLRDYLTSIRWDKTPPGPSLPAEVIANTRAKYLEALKRLTGQDDV